MPPAELLGARLRALGLSPDLSLVTHTNRTVMLSLTGRGRLRIHRGYSRAPDRVLRAIVRYLNTRLPRDRRRRAEREFLAFPVQLYAPSRGGPVRVERRRPGDDALLERLGAIHARLNRRWFGGLLASVPIRLSGRMRTRLGELCLDARTDEPIHIAIGRRHIANHGWAEVEHTVLHEMVHQWQAENRLPVDHGANFRQKAREVGITPCARRRVTRPGATDRPSVDPRTEARGGP